MSSISREFRRTTTGSFHRIQPAFMCWRAGWFVGWMVWLVGRSFWLCTDMLLYVALFLMPPPYVLGRLKAALSAWKQVAMKTGNDRHLTQCNSIQTSSRCQCAALMPHIHVTFSFLIEKLIEMDNLEVSYFRP